jgi:hypothetical protein
MVFVHYALMVYMVAGPGVSVSPAGGADPEPDGLHGLIHLSHFA